MSDISDNSAEDLASRVSEMNITNANTRNRLRTKNRTTRARRTRRKAPPRSTRQGQLRFLHEMRSLVYSQKNLIPRLAFSRLVREIMHLCNPEITHITSAALEALQECSELYLTQYLADAYLLSLHCKRVTLMAIDLELLNVLKQNSII